MHSGPRRWPPRRAAPRPLGAPLLWALRPRVAFLPTGTGLCQNGSHSPRAGESMICAEGLPGAGGAAVSVSVLAAGPGVSPGQGPLPSPRSRGDLMAQPWTLRLVLSGPAGRQPQPAAWGPSRQRPVCGRKGPDAGAGLGVKLGVLAQAPPVRLAGVAGGSPSRRNRGVWGPPGGASHQTSAVPSSVHAPPSSSAQRDPRAEGPSSS